MSARPRAREKGGKKEEKKKKKKPLLLLQSDLSPNTYFKNGLNARPQASGAVKNGKRGGEEEGEKKKGGSSLF